MGKPFIIEVGSSMSAIKVGLVSAAAVGALLSVPLRAEVLEEIIVTAQKREQNVQDVGVSVTALTGNQMEQLGFTNAQQVTMMAPAMILGIVSRPPEPGRVQNSTTAHGPRARRYSGGICMPT